MFLPHFSASLQHLHHALHHTHITQHINKYQRDGLRLCVSISRFNLDGDVVRALYKKGAAFAQSMIDIG